MKNTNVTIPRSLFDEIIKHLVKQPLLHVIDIWEKLKEQAKETNENSGNTDTKGFTIFMKDFFAFLESRKLVIKENLSTKEYELWNIENESCEDSKSLDYPFLTVINRINEFKKEGKI